MIGDKAMKDNEAVCSCCGRIDNKCFMERIVTGRRVQWLCVDCFEHGGKQADYVTKRVAYVKKKKRERS